MAFQQESFPIFPDSAPEPENFADAWTEEEYLPEDDSSYIAESFIPENYEKVDVDTGEKYGNVADALATLPTDFRIVDLLEGLNARQRDAVTALTGPVMVIAGPGSGKTRVLTHRVAALVRLGVAPWQIMAVTFTNKAAAEMRERISVLCGEEEASQMWVSTFHSACARLLRQYHKEANLPRAFSIFDSSDVQKILKIVLTEEGAAVEKGMVKALASTISNAKNHGVSSADLLASMRPSDRADGLLMEKYNTRLTELGGVDFDDLLSKTVTLLQTSLKAREWIQKRSRFLLVDEVQDTNSVQMALLRLICPPTEGFTTDPGPASLTAFLRSSRGNICTVGDYDQGVYSFRGADPSGMSNFSTEYKGSQVVVLEQNYRSTKSILEVVQAIIDPNPAIHRPRLFTDNAQGAPVELYVAESDKDEAEWVVSQIRKSKASHDAHAVLVRTNSQTRVFEEQLTKVAVPYQVVGALRFYDRAEIKDALSYLRLVANPQDQVALARCVNTPKRGIGEVALNSLVTLSRSRGEDPITTLRSALLTGEIPSRARKGFETFLIAYDLILSAAKFGPAEGLRSVSDDAGLRVALAADKTSGLDRVENLDELISAAESFIEGASPTSPEGSSVADMSGWEQTLSFLENVALVSAADSEEVVTPKVSLLTSHASKGKEFSHVYVVGVEDGLYPHERSKDSEEGIEEERRLLFVATSRAKETLSISRALTRYMFSKPQENAPSPFLEDLPASVVKVPPRALRPSAPSWNQNSYSSRNRGGGYGSYLKKSVPAAVTPRPAPAVKRPVGPRLTAKQLMAGSIVSHTVFGEGVVKAIVGEKVTISFEGKVKDLDLSFAPLTLIS